MLSRTETAYPIIVDYFKSIEQLKTDGGYNAYASSEITSANFPHQDSGMKNIRAVLVHFDRRVSNEEALDELDKLGLRAATMAELLAFGAKYRDVQRDFPIIALGSARTHRTGLRHVGCLGHAASKRSIGLDWFGSGWSSYCRFLAAPK
jgi:hypothetical protein